MAYDSRRSGNFYFNSVKINLLFVLVTLVCETCICTVPEASQINSMNVGEVTEEIGNPSEENGEVPSINFVEGDDNDLIAFKRHLGAFAALSKSKPGSKSFIPPSKKHLASVAAQMSGRPIGRLPSDIYKRHLGSLRALSGYKGKPLTRSLKETSAYQMDTPDDTDLAYNTMDDGTRYNLDSQEIQISPKFLLMNTNQPAVNEFQHTSSLQMGTSTGNEELNEDLGINSLSDEATYKPKRFLGSMARGGWFPRHFRGVVSDSTFGKRHIGSLAKMGWMPHAKANNRFALLMDEPLGEIGLKRTDMSQRRRMLYHFAAPSLWTSPRGK